MKRFLKTGLFAAMLSFAAMLTSCITDEHQIGPNEGNGQREITFSVKVPGNTGATRSLRESDEIRIDGVNVLVFEAGASGKFLYSAYAKTTGSNTYTVRLRESANSSEKFDVMMVANASSIISTAYPSGIPANTSRTDILQNLVSTLPENTPFSSSQSATYTMPMWGMTEALEVKEGMASQTIRLHRMVAKIDVMLDAAVTNTTFKLNSVRLYNYNRTGRLIPDATKGNFTATTNPKASAPSLKTGSTTTEGPLLYDNGEMVITDRAMTSTIYTFEVDKGVHWDGSGGGDFMKNTCLVVGGYYGNQSSTPTYYRIDFVDAGGTFLDLLRNHQYNVTIKSVSGAGFTSPDAAFQSRPVNITSEIIPWVDGEMAEVGFDGQYFLGLGRNPVILDTRGETQAITIRTNVPTFDMTLDGGTGTAPHLSTKPGGRLTYTGDNFTYSLSPDGGGDYTLSITATRNETAPRRDEWTIKAALINMSLTVTQNKYAAPGFYTVALGTPALEGGMVAMAPSQAAVGFGVSEGTEITLAPYLNYGYELTGWTVVPAVVSIPATAPYWFDMPAEDLTVTPMYKLRPLLTVNKPEHGTVSLTIDGSAETVDNPRVPVGAAVKATISYDNTRNSFDGWNVTGATDKGLDGDPLTFEFDMPDRDVAVAPTLTPIMRTVTINIIDPVGRGSIIGGTTQQFAVGSRPTISADISKGYKSVTWSGYPTGTNWTANSVTFNMPATDITITATFVKLVLSVVWADANLGGDNMLYQWGRNTAWPNTPNARPDGWDFKCELLESLLNNGYWLASSDYR